MTPHILACALYCNPDGPLNGAGTFAAWLLAAPVVLGVVIWVIRKAVEGGKQMTGRGR